MRSGAAAAFSRSRLPGLLCACHLAGWYVLVPWPAAGQPAGASGTESAESAATSENSPGSAKSGLTLERLLQRIGGKTEQEVRFVEKKHLAVLDAPVESAGVLRYQAPSTLQKNTERPVKESMMLDGDQLVVQREGRRRSVPAAQMPGVAALVGGLRDVLGGNADALRRIFKVVVQGNEREWQVDLLPSDVASAQLVSRITLRGREDQLQEVQTLQADGDRSVMTLSK